MGQKERIDFRDNKWRLDAELSCVRGCLRGDNVLSLNGEELRLSLQLGDCCDADVLSFDLWLTLRHLDSFPKSPDIVDHPALERLPRGK